jgi:hypothetical protein
MKLSAPKPEEDDKANLLSVDLDNDALKDDMKPLYAGHLGVPDGANILRISSPDAFSEFSIEDDGNGRRGRSVSLQPPGQRYISKSPVPSPKSVKKGPIRAFWTRNKGLALVLLAQVFGTLMNVTTRYGLSAEGIHGRGTDGDGIGFLSLKEITERACIRSK